MHRAGIVHNDVALRNLLLRTDPEQVVDHRVKTNFRIIDFGMALLRSTFPVEEEWHARCGKELDQVKALLGLVRNKKARRG
jgi:serine/threonine protein kinase